MVCLKKLGVEIFKENKVEQEGVKQYNNNLIKVEVNQAIIISNPNLLKK